jgi:glucose/arabinose dehydrogenase
MRARFIAAIIPASFFSLLLGGVPPAGFEETIVATAIVQMTGFEWTPDGDLWILTKGGEVLLLHPGSSQLLTALSLSVDSANERGLLGIAVDPMFPSRPYLYLYYTVPGASPHNRVSRFTVVGDILQDELVLLEGPPLVTNFHNAGCLRFGLDGLLYVSMGDNAQGSVAQRLDTLLGKILRIGPDGSIPSSNPFFADPNARHEIWAYGLRNPWRFNVQPATGNLFIADVGEGAWEELDLGVAGANYGFPIVEGVEPAGVTGMTYPIFSYDHDGGSASITGGDHMVSGNYPSQYVGDYFYADFVLDKIFRMRLDANNQPLSNEVFMVDASSPVHVRVGPDGALYYGSFGLSTIYRVAYVGGTNQNPVAAASASPTSGLPPLSVQFDGSDSYDPDGGGVDESWNFGDETPPYNGITPVHIYTTAGVFTPRVEVNDGLNTSMATLRIVSGNSPPAPSISEPIDGSRFNAGDVIAFSGSASDPEEGMLGSGAFTWMVLFHHQTHTHPYLGPTPSISGGTFAAASGGETATDIWYEIILTATDSGSPLGPAATVAATCSVNIYPNLGSFTLATTPRTNLSLTLDGTPLLAPRIVDGVVGLGRTIEAVTPQTPGDGHTYTFVGWSDGGARIHTIATPTAATYTARYMCNLIAEVEDLTLVPGPNGTLSMSWTPPDDLCLSAGPAVYHVYSSHRARPSSPPGQFPLDPVFTLIRTTDQTAVSIPLGFEEKFYLVVGIGSDGSEGPVGAYGR